MKNTELQPGADYDRAVATLTSAAWDNDLLDVAYGFVDSPFGRLLVAMTKRGLVRVEYPNGGIDEQLEGLAAEVSPRLLESPRHTQEVRRELDEYFEGKRQSFSVPVDLSFLRGFGRRVLERTAGIPFGMLATYREVATRAGSPRASRAAGNALAANPVPIVVPCHRVVHSGGGLGGYTGGLDRKVTLLRLEGVDVPPYRPPRPKRAPRPR
ncbi:MAG TPA: methylated-DNA--[protein]-cysteine S-methyltransferase [Actinomycetota bacterium]|nr:methylated-DNA--[protein]-cysteine S-methyltransferase [Actinomycetota bacterium]